MYKPVYRGMYILSHFKITFTVTHKTKTPTHPLNSNSNTVTVSEEVYSAAIC
jgi:hypothetical protein